jgi:hypothetical protein
MSSSRQVSVAFDTRTSVAGQRSNQVEGLAHGRVSGAYAVDQNAAADFVTEVRLAVPGHLAQIGGWMGFIERHGKMTAKAIPDVDAYLLNVSVGRHGYPDWQSGPNNRLRLMIEWLFGYAWGCRILVHGVTGGVDDPLWFPDEAEAVRVAADMVGVAPSPAPVARLAGESTHQQGVTPATGPTDVAVNETDSFEI